MIDFTKTSKRLMIGCIVFLTIFLLSLVIMYKVLHVKHKNDHDSHLTIINEDLPEFSLPTLDDLQVIVDQNILKNKVTLINVWSNNCRSCKQEHAILLKIARYLKGKPINFVGLNNRDDHERAIQWLHIHGNPYNINLFDQKGKLAVGLGAKGLPELFIIDPHSKIQYRYSGAITSIVWEQELRPLLEQLDLQSHK